MEGPYAPLSDSCAKALGDKVYDKRKLAALEVEKLVVELNNKNNVERIRKLIDVLAREFTMSRDTNKRKGGLIGLAATALALGDDCEKYIKEIVHPVLNCMADTEVRIRYFACESLYNIAKVARIHIIPLFPELFNLITKLVTDPDQMVKEGSEVLDRLLKEIVTGAASRLNMEGFIPLLREQIYVRNTFARQHVISWVSALESVPDINMCEYLTEILDGLLLMFDDNMTEIHRMCDALLNQFLKSIRKEPESARIEILIAILIIHAQSTNDLIQSTAINWIREFVALSGDKLLPFTGGIFTAILPCLSYEGESRKEIRDCAITVNKNLMALVSSKEHKEENIKKLDLNSVMEVLRQYLAHNSVHTKVAVLKWIHHLFNEIHNQMSGYAVTLFPVLLNKLSDSSDEVVLHSLVVLAEIVSPAQSKGEFNKVQYKKLLNSLLNLFSEEKEFLENRGSLILRQLCILLNAEHIYRTFAEILAEESVNVKFASVMVRSLNIILLTTSELFTLRNALHDITNPNSASLFVCLYKSWAHCPVSTLSLCLLAQCYEHVSDLVSIFGTLEITLEILNELDKLVQLIESPIFASLRLTLVSKANNGADAQHLAHALFGILMILPQTEAFTMLKSRLQCVPNYWGQRPDRNSRDSQESRSRINFKELFDHFVKIQQMHRTQKMAQRKRSLLGWDSDNSGSVSTTTSPGSAAAAHSEIMTESESLKGEAAPTTQKSKSSVSAAVSIPASEAPIFIQEEDDGNGEETVQAPGEPPVTISKSSKQFGTKGAIPKSSSGAIPKK